jgi:hypothetical protein
MPHKNQSQCSHPLRRREKQTCLDCGLYMPKMPMPIKLVSQDRHEITIELVQEDDNFFMVEFKTWPHWYYWKAEVNQILDYLMEISLDKEYYVFQIQNKDDLEKNLSGKFNKISFHIIYN